MPPRNHHIRASLTKSGEGKIRLFYNDGDVANATMFLDCGGTGLIDPAEDPDLLTQLTNDGGELDLLVEGCTPGEVELEWTYEFPADFCPGCQVSDVLKMTVMKVDLDIDSDIDEGFGPPDRDAALEDAIEDDSTKPGKFICVNDDDSDNDGIPDYADGFDRDGQIGTPDDLSANDDFFQLIVELPELIDLSVARLKITYKDSDPASVSHTGAVWAPGSGFLRIWKKDGNESRDKNSANASSNPGDYVPAGEYDDLSSLGLSGATRTVTLYVEGVDHETATIEDRQIKIEVDPDGPGPAVFVCPDAVLTTVIKADLDGDGNHDGTVTDSAEEEAGEDVLPGVIALCNIDDDDQDGNKDSQGVETGTVDSAGGNNDFDDFAPIWPTTITLPR